MLKLKKALGMKVPPVPKQVIYVSVKDVNFDAKNKLVKKLDLLKKKNKKCDAILVGINVGPAASGRESKNMITQADLMGKILKAKAKELEVPLVTYAEEMSVMNGMHLLMYGDHILANEVSLLGNIGNRVTPKYLKDFVESWHVKLRYVHHGENKVRFNSFEPLKQKDVDWLLNMYRVRSKYVIDFIMEQRKDKVVDADKTR